MDLSIIFTMTMMVGCVYGYAFEPQALSESLVERIDKIVQLSDGEKQFFQALRFINLE